MIKRAIKRILQRLSSLRFRFLVVFFFAMLIGIGAYVSLRTIAIAYIDTVYISEEHKEQREKAYLEDLRNFIKENDVSLNDTSKISEWVRENRYVYLLISKEGEIFFTSDDATDEDDTDQTTPGEGEGEGVPDDGEEENGNGGVTVKYPSREELLEYAKANEMHLIDFGDGPAAASFAEFTEYLYYDVANIATLVIAFAILLSIMLLYIRRVTGRILDLGEDVNAVAAGNTASVISVSGKDEIATLAANVENMRSSMVENYEKEKAALNANSELITSMSHDIRTPLTVLLGYLDIMRASADGNEEMQAYIKAAESTALRLKRLSDDMFSYLLVFGNPQSQPELESYNADTLIGQMLSEHVLLIGESGYKVDLNSIDEPSLVGKTVRTDPQSLVRIFDNAFSNLYKYADKENPIKISVSAGACNVIIEISNRIRRDGERVESNGIGLRTCKKLAEQIGAGFEFGGDGNTYSVKLTLPCK